jgi:hypothetical protein
MGYECLVRFLFRGSVAFQRVLEFVLTTPYCYSIIDEFVTGLLSEPSFRRLIDLVTVAPDIPLPEPTVVLGLVESELVVGCTAKRGGLHTLHNTLVIYLIQRSIQLSSNIRTRLHIGLLLSGECSR